MRVAVIAAAGFGVRMGVPEGKQYFPLAGVPLLVHTIRAFELAPSVESTVVVVNRNDVDFCQREIVQKFGLGKVAKVVGGGVERQDSVARGLAALPRDASVVAIHDGARPLVTPGLIDACFNALSGWEGTVAAVPLKDTPKMVSGEMIVKTLERKEVWLAQTPQVFQVDVIREAHERAELEDFLGTDDASLVERLGGRIRLVPGSDENIKITTLSDLVIAEAILAAKKRPPTADRRPP